MLSPFRLPLPLLALLTTLVSASAPTNYTCPTHLYTVKIFSHSPLVIYIPSFLTPTELAHLKTISTPRFTASQIADSTGAQGLASTRNSQSTSLESDDVVRCIEERALTFQGPDMRRERLEPLQAVQYHLNQHYAPHTDWFTSASQATPEFGGNRVSSFFVYVSASEDIAGGGTRFPMLDPPKEEEWCEFVNCDAGWDEGVTFRPVEGNAVFWRNMEGGRGDGRTVRIFSPQAEREFADER
jgi:prolyl 4-hydroxylase